MKLTPTEVELIRKHRQEAELEKVREWKPTPANEISVDEKCAAFDRLHEQAMEHFNSISEQGYADDDSGHYMYEEVMKLLGKDVFKAMNKLSELVGR